MSWFRGWKTHLATLALAGLSLGASAPATGPTTAPSTRPDTLVSTTFITMHYKNVPVLTILEDFEKQAGADLGVHRPDNLNAIANIRGSIDMDHLDFWKALDQIGNVTGLHAQPWGGEPRMVLQRFMGGMNFQSDKSQICGPFIIIPQCCSQSISYTGDQPQDSGLNFQMMIMAEPKLHLAGGLGNDWLKTCVDDKGHSLMPKPDQMSGMNTNGSQWWWQISTTLQSVPGMGDKISTLSGLLHFSVQQSIDVVTVDDLAKLHNLSHLVNGSFVTLEKFNRDNGQYQLTLSIVGALAGQNGTDQTGQLVTSIQILDDQNQQLANNGFNTTGGARTKIIVSYGNNTSDGRPVGAPKKLRWEIPTHLKQVDMPFEIHDLDLPNPP